MPLVKSPILTAAKLAANRANARKSAGPRTPQGKRKIVLNGLKHGRYSRDFRANLVKVGADAELFDWIRARVFACFLPVGPHLCWDAERLAREVWCRVCWANRSRASLRALRRALREACGPQLVLSLGRVWVIDGRLRQEGSRRACRGKSTGEGRRYKPECGRESIC